MKEALNREFDDRTIGYDIIIDSFIQIIKIHQEFYESFLSKSPNYDSLNPDLEFLSDYSNHFLIPVSCCISSVLSMSSIFEEFDSKINSIIPSLKTINPTRKELKNSADSFLSEMQRIHTEQLSNSFLSRQNLSLYYTQMSVLDDEVKNKNIKLKKAIPQMTDLFLNYKKYSDIVLKQKNSIIKSTRELTGATEDHARSILQFEKMSFEQLIINFKKILIEFKKISEFITNIPLYAIQTSTTKIKELNFIKPLTENYDLSFKEFLLPKFERFKFSNKYLNPTEPNLQKFIFNIYPISMVYSIKDFKSDNINIKKNERLFLMENSNREWAIILKPELFTYGFIPRILLKQIGENLIIYNNSFCALIEKNDNNLIVETFDQNLLNLNINDVIIL